MKLPDLSQVKVPTKVLVSSGEPFCPEAEDHFSKALSIGRFDKRPGVTVVVPVVSERLDNPVWFYRGKVEAVLQKPSPEYGEPTGIVLDDSWINNFIAYPVYMNQVFLAGRPIHPDFNIVGLVNQDSAQSVSPELLDYDIHEWCEFKDKLIDNLHNWGIL